MAITIDGMKLSEYAKLPKLQRTAIAFQQRQEAYRREMERLQPRHEADDGLNDWRRAMRPSAECKKPTPPFLSGDTYE